MNTVQKTTDAIEAIRNFYNMVDVYPKFIDFSQWADIKRGRGIYILLNDDEVIYVGRGNIKARQESHYKKLTGALTEHDNKEPEGWRHIREERGIDPDNLLLIYVYLNGKDDEAAMEGGLIKILQPYTNDEIFSKNAQLGDL